MNVLFALRRAKQFYGSNPASGGLNWAEFYELVYRKAAFLRGLGIEKGDRVAVWMLNSHEYLELYFATAIAGVAIVPLNTRWHVKDVDFTLVDSGAKALFVDAHFAAKVGELEHAPRVLVSCDCSNANVAFEEPDENDMLGLFYTSGTTGGPKGVMLTHRNLWANTVQSMMAIGITQGVWLHAAPMFHAADLWTVYMLAMLGSANFYLPTFDPEAFLRSVETHRVTDTVIVPTMISMVLHHPSFDAFDLSSLRRVLYGASPIPGPLIELAMRKLPHVEFIQAYGMTETSPVLTVLRHEDHHGARLAAAGRPVLGVEVRVVDPADREVGVGECGEVIARGANIMKGYWNRPEISAEALRGGWMHTGDLGRFDKNGFLYILDRKKDMIKPGSENVYSPEVESTILGHPSVLEAAVIGVPHEKWGEAIRAVVVCRAGCEVEEMELIAWCRERMTHFKCPTSVVVAEALPKGGTGKIQKNVLRERYGGSNRYPAASSQN
ncbi:MAG TPA: long-chain fatty acid--CoA ligase [Bryobacteraceae bacterium]|nr:long-chain fatty acid--CoA ligase [Bryobacteraceae bacterium]